MIEDSSNKLTRQRQYVSKSELTLNCQRDLLRKADTRRKIQLGGLIIKARLEEESSNVILGILCDAKDKLKMNRQRWCEIGSEQFSKVEYAKIGDDHTKL